MNQDKWTPVRVQDLPGCERFKGLDISGPLMVRSPVDLLTSQYTELWTESARDPSVTFHKRAEAVSRNGVREYPHPMTAHWATAMQQHIDQVGGNVCVLEWGVGGGCLTNGC